MKEQLIIELAKLRARVYELEEKDSKNNYEMNKQIEMYKLKISELKKELLIKIEAENKIK